MEEYTCNHKKEPCTKKVPLFAALSDEEMLKIARMTNHIHYQKGTNGDTRRSKIRYPFHHE